MIIIPFDKKLEWRNPPIITILLIIINTIVYFSFQINDDDKVYDARHYYYQSGLADIEFPYYKQALLDQEESNNPISPVELEHSFFELQFNVAFMNALRNETIITPSNSDYPLWRSKRTHLDDMTSNIFTWQYSLKTGEPTLVTMITHMFLHGSFSHLWGNMLFLLAVGFIVELSMSHSLYLTSYLLVGIGSGLFTLLFANSLIPSVGASGAISGLMGIYAVLFGTRKVRFFYFIYIYFDYVKLPAIYLLVLWLGFEVYQQVAYSESSNINYSAHIGGLLSGAVTAFMIKTFQSKSINHDYINERETNEKFNASLNKANDFIRTLDHNKAVPIFAKLLAEQPDNHVILYSYYKTSKLNSGSEHHHLSAVKILSLTEHDPATNQLMADVFSDYIKVPKARLSISLINSLMRRFTTTNALEQAEKLLSIMQTNPDKFSQLPQYLEAFHNKVIHANRHTKLNSE